jgi:hypothetical protein
MPEKRIIPIKQHLVPKEMLDVWEGMTDRSRFAFLHTKMAEQDTRLAELEERINRIEETIEEDE